MRAEKLQQVRKQTEGLSLQGLLIALAFGERAWLDKNTWSIYQQTNTAHLIAISGLHIGLAMGIGFDPLVSLCAFFTFSMEKSSLFPKSAVDFEFISFAIWVIAFFYAFATFSI